MDEGNLIDGWMDGLAYVVVVGLKKTNKHAHTKKTSDKNN